MKDFNFLGMENEKYPFRFDLENLDPRFFRWKMC